jgi:hypothetical protein
VKYFILKIDYFTALPTVDISIKIRLKNKNGNSRLLEDSPKFKIFGPQW